MLRPKIRLDEAAQLKLWRMASSRLAFWQQMLETLAQAAAANAGFRSHRLASFVELRGSWTDAAFRVGPPARERRYNFRYGTSVPRSAVIAAACWESLYSMAGVEFAFRSFGHLAHGIAGRTATDLASFPRMAECRECGAPERLHLPGDQHTGTCVDRRACLLRQASIAAATSRVMLGITWLSSSRRILHAFDSREMVPGWRAIGTARSLCGLDGHSMSGNGDLRGDKICLRCSSRTL